LNAPAEFARNSSGDLIDIRAQLLVEEFTEARVVIDATDYPANLSASVKTM
jgi:hypothetical protein